MPEFIYILTNPRFQTGTSVVKIGSTQCIERRKWDYLTGLPEPSTYVAYFELLTDSAAEIDTKLRTQWLVDLWHPGNGGREFYRTPDPHRMIPVVVDLLRNQGIGFKIVYGDPFPHRPIKSLPIEPELDLSNLPCLETHFPFVVEEKQLRPYQIDGMTAIQDFLNSEENQGQIHMACGLGKSILIAKSCALVSSTLILTPTINLVHQLAGEVRRWVPGIEILEICSHGPNSTTNVEVIKEFQAKENRVMISTYDSAELMRDFPVDLICYDEAHRTVGNVEREITKTLTLNGKKKIYLTATPKIIKDTVSDDDELDSVSMDQDYGSVIFTKDVAFGIENRYLTDYQIVIHVSPETHRRLDVVVEKMIAGIFCKPLLFFGSIDESRAGAEYLKQRLDGKIFVDFIDSRDSRNPLDIVKNFEDAKFGILCNIRMCNEGMNLITCDASVFMSRKSSEIDLYQSAMRCLRPCKMKYRSTLMFFVTNEETETKYIRQVLSTMNFYDHRLKSRMKRELKSGSSLLFEKDDVFDSGMVETESMYDRFWNLLKSSSPDEKFAAVMDFIRVNNCEPKRLEAFGSFWNNVKMALRGKLNQYQQYLQSWHHQLKTEFPTIYDEIMNIKINVPVEEKFEALMDFIRVNGRAPKQSEDLGNFWHAVKKSLRGKNRYQQYLESWKSQIQREFPFIYDEIMRDKSNDQQEKFEAVMDFIRINNREPKKSEDLGSFWADVKMALRGKLNKYQQYIDSWHHQLKTEFPTIYDEIMRDKSNDQQEKFEAVMNFIRINNCEPKRSEGQFWTTVKMALRGKIKRYREYLQSWHHQLKTEFPAIYDEIMNYKL